MEYKQKDIKEIVKNFEVKILPMGRYASFDYCYNYFKLTSPKALVADMEKSCLVLGFYLASWGMFRGSSFMLEKSSKNFKSLIEYISLLDESIWDIDIDKFDEKNIEIVMSIYHKIKGILVIGNNAHLTLVTKIMLGVFGFIPAYDRFFINSFGSIFEGRCGFTSFNKNSLICIREFYIDNKKEIDKLSFKNQTINFDTGKNTGLCYPKSKVIDMYGFTKGLLL